MAQFISSIIFRSCVLAVQNVIRKLLRFCFKDFSSKLRQVIEIFMV